MLYQNRHVQIISSKSVLGFETCWVKVLETGEFLHVLRSDLQEENYENGLSFVRYSALAAKILDEISQKHILSPLESSLIPLPHQMLVLEKAMSSLETRFLLADEVGMGKTIEAGLILKELKMRGDISRILLIVPKTAMLQWQSEMKERFNEDFRVYDSEFISSLSKMFSDIQGQNANLNLWKQDNQIIVSTDALKPLEKRQGWSSEKIAEYNKYRIESVVNADFDMVIIDEAHRMGGSSALVSRFRLAETLCDSVPRVLLLSATPHRGKSDHFRRVLQLLDADAFSGEGMPSIKEIQPYVFRSEKRFAVDYDGKPLFNKRSTIRCEVVVDEKKNREQLMLYENVTSYVRELFGKASGQGNNAAALVLVGFQKMASSSTAAIEYALKNRLNNLLTGKADSEPFTDGISEDVDFNITEYAASQKTGSENLPTDEVGALKKLISDAEHCLKSETDAKAAKLLELISKIRRENAEEALKVIVFTEFIPTQKYLVDLLEQEGISCSFINGSMDMEKRKNALVSFKNEKEILVATDSAGESLNMQFCHIVINYDIPWNPMALEQRIGRVDRIGQKHPVVAINMTPNNSIDSRVYDIIVEKLDKVLNELGIDKTGDVLDSTMETEKIRHLYLQSLLDPQKLEADGEAWLSEIKSKLKDFKSTEGVLPSISGEEIDAKSAQDIKYSPLPVWLEDMLDQYTRLHNGKIDKQLGGLTNYTLGAKTIKAVFNSDAASENPDATFITLQSSIVKKILETAGTDTENNIPILESSKDSNVKGYFYIWNVSAKNRYDSRESYTPIFISDEGSVYPSYASQIWTNLIQEKGFYRFIGYTEHPKPSAVIEEKLQDIFYKMQFSIQKNVKNKADKKLKALAYEEKRINRIGIENIKKGKLKKLEAEKRAWQETFEKDLSIVPDAKEILALRVE